MAVVDTTLTHLIGEIAIAADRLEQAIDRCIVTCMPSIPPDQQMIVFSRLSFRQRLDIVHELALPRLHGNHNEPFTAWRRRVAKVWSRFTRSSARARYSAETLDELSARRILRQLNIESDAALQWAHTLDQKEQRHILGELLGT